MKIKNKLFSITYYLLLIAFTVYVILDTFVIVRVYEPVMPPESSYIPQQTPAESAVQTPASSEGRDTEHLEETPAESISPDESEPTIDLSEPIITENSYKDNDIEITIHKYRVYESDVFVADIKLSSPEFLKTALAKNTYGKRVTEKTSTMAENNGAILAVNGDYYGARNEGLVFRNGNVYRSVPDKNREALVIYKDGSLEVIAEKDASIPELVSNGAYHVLSFGPGLLVDGEIVVNEKTEVAVAGVSNPRTAIGIIDDLHYLLVVSDGRTVVNRGLKLYEMAEFLQGMGVVTGYNLDGGGSATMWFNGKLVNNPTENGKEIKERSVSDIVYIGH